MTKKKCIVCDVDGVLLNSSFIIKEIFKKELKGNAKWDYFYAHCNSDKVTPIGWIRGYLNVAVLSGYFPILSTARNEHNRVATEEKLNKENIVYYKMYMRKDGDFRPSAEVKREHLQEIQKEFEIVVFLDDDVSNTKMAQEMGICTFLVPREEINNENTSD